MRPNFLPPILAVLVLGLATPAFSQAVPSATESKGMPLSVGFGLSDFNLSFDNGYALGATLWLDYTPPLPARLHGLGIEAEGKWTGLDRSYAQRDIREEVATGGPTYTFHSFHHIHPYTKFLMGFGNTEYPIRSGSLYHQTRTITTAGGGVTYKILPGLSARVDYEYQWWPDFWIKQVGVPGAYLTPYGFTFGASYDLRQLLHRHSSY
jgi:opacity protein-like surface antigen